MKGSRPLTTEEISATLTAISSNRHAPRDRCLFILGIRTGFRISELLSLKIKDAKNVSEITVSRAHMKKKIEGRTVPLHPEAKEAISYHLFFLATTDIEGPLFPSQTGGGMKRSAALKMFTKAFKSCGLSGKLGTHCMRKTFAKRMYEILGHDLLKVQEAMGHKSLSSTASYIGVNQSEIREAFLKQ